MTNEESNEIVDYLFGHFPRLRPTNSNYLAYFEKLKTFEVVETMKALESLFNSKSSEPPSALALRDRVLEIRRSQEEAQRVEHKRQLNKGLRAEMTEEEKERIKKNIEETKKQFPNLFSNPH